MPTPSVYSSVSLVLYLVITLTHVVMLLMIVAAVTFFMNALLECNLVTWSVGLLFAVIIT